MNTLQRRKTHQVHIDHLIVGSEAPVIIQSMTNTDTADAQATALQVKELSDAGSEMVRITVNSPEAASKVAEIRQRLDDMGYPTPLIGDFHFNGERLLAEFPDCGKALSKYRINPGNVGKGAKGDEKFAFMIRTAAENNKAVRIGVNWGSLDQSLATRDGCQSGICLSKTSSGNYERSPDCFRLGICRKSRSARITRRQNYPFV